MKAMCAETLWINALAVSKSHRGGCCVCNGVMVSVCTMYIRAGQASSSPVTAQVFVSLKLYFKFAKKQVRQQDYHMIISSDFALWWQPWHLALGLESELQDMNSYDLMQEFGKHVQQQFLAGLANFYSFSPWQQLWPLRSVLGLVIWPGGLGLGLTSSDLIQELGSL